MSPLTSGLRLGNRYTLRDLIGVGGMSQVWRADDEVLGRPVAVKVLTAALAADPTLSTATWAEARAAAQLAHPHVAQVYDYGEAPFPDGEVLPYLVMELVDGQSLADRLRSGPLPWRQAASICAQVAAAVAAAHRTGVVHRDIKPGNVMLTREGAKVLDFGLAALAGRRPTAYAGRLVGTPAYAAPERLVLGPAAPDSDVYALGVLLYEALTGHQPVPVTSWQQAADAHHAAMPVPALDVAGLPRQIGRLCEACLARDPAERPTADELARALATMASDPPPAGGGAPTLIGEPMAVAPEPRGGYAVGSARLPHPPTMIDPAVAALDAGPDARAAGRRPRMLVPGLIAAVVVLGITLVAVSASLLSRPGDQAGGPAASPTSTATSKPPTPRTPTVTATTPQAIADKLDATIAAALAAGRIDADTANRLRDKVRDLRGGDEDRGGKKVRELQRQINEMLRDGKLDQQTASQLTALLQPLTGSKD